MDARFFIVVLFNILFHINSCACWTIEDDSSFDHEALQRSRRAIGNNNSSSSNSSSNNNMSLTTTTTITTTITTPTTNKNSSPHACLTTMFDYQDFYSIAKAGGRLEEYWVELKDDRKHQRLSRIKSGFEKVYLAFRFPVFGHLSNHVYLTTSGNIYISPSTTDLKHSHYITPFLGHFNPSLDEESAIYYENIDERFVVEWRNVFLNRTANGPYTFQTILYKNGTVAFLYKKIPSDVVLHSVMMGLHTGLHLNIKDAEVFYMYKDARIFADAVHDNAVVVFTPLPACDLATHAQTCTLQTSEFFCQSCNITKPCSAEATRRVHNWFATNCITKIPPSCQNVDDRTNVKVIAVLVVAIVLVVLLAVMAAWFYYAYTRPNSKSGRWLIEHRPSQWIGLIMRSKGSSKEEQEPTNVKQDNDDPGY